MVADLGLRLVLADRPRTVWESALQPESALPFCAGSHRVGYGLPRYFV